MSWAELNAFRFTVTCLAGWGPGRTPSGSCIAHILLSGAALARSQTLWNAVLQEWHERAVAWRVQREEADADPLEVHVARQQEAFAAWLRTTATSERVLEGLLYAVMAQAVQVRETDDLALLAQEAAEVLRAWQLARRTGA